MNHSSLSTPVLSAYSWPDGARYEGEFLEGHHSGKGKYTFADGSVYSGEWKQGQYHGTRSDALFRFCIWLNEFDSHSDFLEGYGQCIWSDGRAYVGMWQMGKAHGHGKETNPDGSIRHDGLWSFDAPVRNRK